MWNKKIYALEKQLGLLSYACKSIICLNNTGYVSSLMGSSPAQVAFITYDAQQRKEKMKFGEMNNSLKKSILSSQVLWFLFIHRGKVGYENTLQATYVNSLCTFTRRLRYNKNHKNSKWYNFLILDSYIVK